MAEEFEGLNEENLELGKSLAATLTEILETEEEIIKQLKLEKDIKLQIAMLEEERANDLYPEIVDGAIDLNAQLKKQIEFQSKINEKALELKKNNPFSEWKEKITEIAANFKAIAQDQVVASGLFIGAVAKNTAEVLGNVEKIRQELGLAGHSIVPIVENLGAATIEGVLLGNTIGDNVEAMKSLINQTNDLTLATTDNIKTVARLSNWYNVSAEDGAQLIKIFSELSDHNEQMTADMIDYSERYRLRSYLKVPTKKMDADVPAFVR